MFASTPVFIQWAVKAGNRPKHHVWVDPVVADPIRRGILISARKNLAMATIQIELTEATARAAREAGLLTPQTLERLLIEALARRRAAAALLSVADSVAAAGIEPMSMDEINAEVKAVRTERQRRACGY